MIHMNNSELSEGLKTIRLTKYLTEIPLLIFGLSVTVYFALGFSLFAVSRESGI